MTNNIRAVLSPLLIVSYMFGIKIVEFPASVPRLWLSRLYIVLMWSVYHFLLVHTNVYHMHENHVIYRICFWLNIFTTLLSIILGMYYDEKFRSCLRKLNIVDDSLKTLGIMTDYHKLYVRIVLVVVGWLIFILWLTITHAIWHGHHGGTVKSLCISFMLKYATYVNCLDDLIFTNILAYIGLKFDQMNKYFQKIERNDEHTVMKAWKKSISPLRLIEFNQINEQRIKLTNRKFDTWIVIHLHLELRKISRELNTIFGIQMTVKMGAYFAFIALALSNIFDIMFGIFNFHKNKLSLTFIVSLLLMDSTRLFLINYICEEVSIKAYSTGDIINRIPYSTYDIIIRENILQCLLQISLVPLKFCGLGLFRFGLKFFHGFCTSVTTVIVILVQSNT